VSHPHDVERFVALLPEPTEAGLGIFERDRFVKIKLAISFLELMHLGFIAVNDKLDNIIVGLVSVVVLGLVLFPGFSTRIV
jgi:hypothetical protein